MARRFHPRFRLARLTIASVVVAIVVSACGDDRPTVAEWQPTWDEISAAIPGEVTIGESPSPSVCSDALAYLRSNRGDLFPTPDLAIDTTVTAWIEIAEEAFFECPPRSEQIGSFAEAYAELIRLQGEIDLVLDMDAGS